MNDVYFRSFVPNFVLEFVAPSFRHFSARRENGIKSWALELKVHKMNTFDKEGNFIHFFADMSIQSVVMYPSPRTDVNLIQVYARFQKLDMEIWRDIGDGNQSDTITGKLYNDNPLFKTYNVKYVIKHTFHVFYLGFMEFQEHRGTFYLLRGFNGKKIDERYRLGTLVKALEHKRTEIPFKLKVLFYEDEVFFVEPKDEEKEIEGKFKEMVVNTDGTSV